MAVIEQIDMLEPGGDDPRRFFGILSGEPGFDHFLLLLSEQQATALRDEFGLDLVAL